MVPHASDASSGTSGDPTHLRLRRACCRIRDRSSSRMGRWSLERSTARRPRASPVSVRSIAQVDSRDPLLRSFPFGDMVEITEQRGFVLLPSDCPGQNWSGLECQKGLATSNPNCPNPTASLGNVLTCRTLLAQKQCSR